MSRRRLVVVVAVLALVAAGAAWSWAIWHQHRVEQQLVGTWRYFDPRAGGGEVRLVIRPDGTYRSARAAGPDWPPAFWSVRGQEFSGDFEARPLHPAVRPLAALVGYRRKAAAACRFEVAADTLTFIQADGSRQAFTRAPAD